MEVGKKYVFTEFLLKLSSPIVFYFVFLFDNYVKVQRPAFKKKVESYYAQGIIYPIKVLIIKPAYLTPFF